MRFQFDSLQELLEMAGHGQFVWTAVLVSLLVMAWLLIKPLQQHQENLRNIARQVQREQQHQSVSEVS
jgi:heme exporter protein CcmD